MTTYTISSATARNIGQNMFEVYGPTADWPDGIIVEHISQERFEVHHSPVADKNGGDFTAVDTVGTFDEAVALIAAKLV